MKKLMPFLVMLIIVIMVVPTSVTAATNDSAFLTLKMAKELALKNSTEVKQYQLNVDKSDKAKRDADEAYSKIVANYFVEAQETMVVNAREGYRAAVNAYADSKDFLENMKIGLEYDIESLFFAILTTEKELKIMQYDLRMQADLVQIERLKLDMGMSTANAVRQAEMALNSLHSAYNMKNNHLLNYKAAMNRYIGREPDMSLQLDTEIQLDFPKVLFTPEDTYRKARENYLVIKQLERTIAEKEKDKDWYGYNQSDKIENLNNSIKEAKINKENAEKSLKQIINNIYDKLSLAQRNITTTKVNLEVIEKSVNFDKQKYQLGMISALELNASQKALEQAKKDHQKAEFDYYLALRELMLAEKGIVLTT